MIANYYFIPTIILALIIGVCILGIYFSYLIGKRFAKEVNNEK